MLLHTYSLNDTYVENGFENTQVTNMQDMQSLPLAHGTTTEITDFITMDPAPPLCLIYNDTLGLLQLWNGTLLKTFVFAI